MSHALFFMGVRTTTWVAVLAFVSLALVARDRSPLKAGFAWLAGYEALFQIASLAEGRPLPALGWAPFVLIGLGLVAVRWARPEPFLMAASLLVFALWLATGFHVNGHDPASLDPLGEVLNESSKTLWALAYLIPPLRERIETKTVPERDAAPRAGAGR